MFEARPGDRDVDVPSQQGLSERLPARRAGSETRVPRMGMGLALTLLMLVTVALAAGVTHLLWQQTSKQNVLDVAQQLNDEIIDGIRREIDDLAGRTEAVQQGIREVFSQGVINHDDRERRKGYYMALLRANPHLSWISFGYPNGDFFGAQRRDEVNYRYVDSDWDPAKAEATRSVDYYVDDGFKAYFTHSKTKYNDYHAPSRRWYEKAILTDGVIWTDVYVFASSRRPGINTAVPLEIDGETVGVISIAIELERLSSFLQSLSVGQSGTAVILNAAGEVIAFHDTKVVRMESKEGERPTLKTLGAIDHPHLKALSEALQTARLSVVDIRERVEFIQELPGSGEPVFVTLEPVGLEDWVIATVVPEADFLARVDRNVQQLLGLLIAAVTVVALLASLFARAVFGRPLAKIVTQIGKVERFELETVEPVPSVIREIHGVSDAVVTMRQGLASFGKYLSIDLVRTLIKQQREVGIGGENRTLSMLFMDLEGFTAHTEALGPKLLPYLAEYFSDMSGRIITNRGTIDKYIGDAIMAFWGAPHYNENHATDCCRAAVQCLRTLDMRRAEWASKGQPSFNLRIGLNSGRVIVGNVGSAEKLDYTVLGDPVNLAARLESLNKVYGTRLLIGAHTFELAKYDIVARRLDAVAVKGKEEVVTVFELIAMQDEIDPGLRFDWITAYERGLDLMAARNWVGAIEQFLMAIDERGGEDAPSSVMIERCRQTIEAGPAERAPKGAKPRRVRDSGGSVD